MKLERDNMTEIITKVSCYTEYDRLKKVALCVPQFMTIGNKINETQKHYAQEGIHRKKAMEQHQAFVNELEARGVEVILLTPSQDYPEQVFTRDVGFVLGDNIFVAQMAHDIRKGEEAVLQSKLESEEISYCHLNGDKIEGGDVIIDGDTVFVGLSHRTSKKAVARLRQLLPRHQVVEVPFQSEYLHLDCVFNPISPTEALIYSDAIEPEIKAYLGSRYQLIQVDEKEQFTLGTNVLSIGNKTLFSLPSNQHTNTLLKEKGYTVIEVDISEIIKSGGAFRCCTLPLLRE